MVTFSYSTAVRAVPKEFPKLGTNRKEFSKVDQSTTDSRNQEVVHLQDLWKLEISKSRIALLCRRRLGGLLRYDAIAMMKTTSWYHNSIVRKRQLQYI
jgi:hypothetical protein